MSTVKKQNLKIALTLAHLTLTEFAERHGVSAQAIDQVAAGKDKSKRLNLFINRFIATEFKKAKIVFGIQTRGGAATQTASKTKALPRVFTHNKGRL